MGIIVTQGAFLVWSEAFPDTGWNVKFLKSRHDPRLRGTPLLSSLKFHPAPCMSSDVTEKKMI